MKSMRTRLILSFALVVAISVLTMLVAMRMSAAREVRAFMFRGGMTGTEDLVEALEAHYDTFRTWDGVEALLSTTGHRHGRGAGMGGGMMNQRLRLADSQGNFVADSDSTSPSGRISTAELEEAITLSVDRQVVGYLLPEGGIAFSQGDESFLVFRLTQAAITAGLVAGGGSLLLALLLAYRLLQPVGELTQAAKRLAQGDLGQRVPVRGGDELSMLGAAFNHMAGSLEQAEASRSALTADIAHELRNPLAVQRASLEALQDGIYPLNPANLEPILEQNHLLTRLVDDLRTLALAESGQLRLELTEVDFTGLVKRVVERFIPQAAGRGVELDFDSGPEYQGMKAYFRLDPMRVEQILGNLLSNALRFTPDQGQIEVQVNFEQNVGSAKSLGSAEGDALPVGQVIVRDTGPGIPQEALPYIFERFYRADRARSRAEGGTGLGLAIARQLAEAHGGSLEAANHPDGGAIFVLTMPTTNVPTQEGQGQHP